MHYEKRWHHLEAQSHEGVPCGPEPAAIIVVESDIEQTSKIYCPAYYCQIKLTKADNVRH